MQRKTFLRAAAAAALAAAAGTASAQAWPSKPITMIIPFPPGGTLDVVGRMAQRQCAQVVESPMAGHGGIHRQPQAREALRRFIDGVRRPGSC